MEISTHTQRSDEENPGGFADRCREFPLAEKPVAVVSAWYEPVKAHGPSLLFFIGNTRCWYVEIIQP